MEDMLIMSKKELQRKTFLENVKCHRLNLLDVANRLEISYRQTKRVWKRFKEEGDKGLSHKGRGRMPQNAYPAEFKESVLNLYQEKYYEFGPTYAAEKLYEDDGIWINDETLRLWLKAEGLWSRKRKRKIYREKRERRATFGELLQIDGSIHRWFDNDEQHYCLLNMVDDATGTCIARLDKGETTKVLLEVLKEWIIKYGIPKEVYVDLKSVYVGFKKLKEKYDDDLLVQEGFSVFEQVCKALGIVIIRAYSAQAKGRVERKHAVFQDRLVKDLKLYRINNITDANIYLDKFLYKINAKFAKPITEFKDIHRKIDEKDLDQIICWKYKRQLKNDWTIQFNREYYQILKGHEDIIRPKEFLEIKRYLDGTIKFWYGTMELSYQKLKAKPEPFFDECSYINKKLDKKALTQIISWQYKRQIKEDGVVQLNGEYFQINDYENIIRPGEFIIIKRYVNGQIQFLYKTMEVSYQKLATKPKLATQSCKQKNSSSKNPILFSLRAKRNKHKTPWGRFNPNWLKAEGE